MKIFVEGELFKESNNPVLINAVRGLLFVDTNCIIITRKNGVEQVDLFGEAPVELKDLLGSDKSGGA